MSFIKGLTLTITRFKSGEKSINWVSIDIFRDLKVILKLNLQTSKFSQKSDIEVYLPLWPSG